jgi:hypothetical protein
MKAEPLRRHCEPRVSGVKQSTGQHGLPCEWIAARPLRALAMTELVARIALRSRLHKMRQLLPLPGGEGRGEGVQPIDSPYALTRRFAPTSPHGRGEGRSPDGAQRLGKNSACYASPRTKRSGDPGSIGLSANASPSSNASGPRIALRASGATKSGDLGNSERYSCPISKRNHPPFPSALNLPAKTALRIAGFAVSWLRGMPRVDADGLARALRSPGGLKTDGAWRCREADGWLISWTS